MTAPLFPRHALMSAMRPEQMPCGVKDFKIEA